MPWETSISTARGPWRFPVVPLISSITALDVSLRVHPCRISPTTKQRENACRVRFLWWRESRRCARRDASSAVRERDLPGLASRHLCWSDKRGIRRFASGHGADCSRSPAGLARSTSLSDISNQSALSRTRYVWAARSLRLGWLAAPAACAPHRDRSARGRID